MSVYLSASHLHIDHGSESSNNSAYFPLVPYVSLKNKDFIFSPKITKSDNFSKLARTLDLNSRICGLWTDGLESTEVIVISFSFLSSFILESVDSFDPRLMSEF